MNFGEDFTRTALESLGYFVIQGFKIGLREVDFLAVKRTGKRFEFFHIEVQISWNPSGVLRGQSKYEDSARNWKKAANDYIQKKFLHKKLIKEIREIFGSSRYKRMFIYGKLKEPRQISVLKAKDIECISLEKLVHRAAQSSRKTKAFTEMYKISRIE